MRALIVIVNLSVAAFFVWSAAAEFRKPSPAVGVIAVFEVHR